MDGWAVLLGCNERLAGTLSRKLHPHVNPLLSRPQFQIFNQSDHIGFGRLGIGWVNSVLLVQAEIAKLKDKPLKAMKLYARALHEAKVNEFLYHEVASYA